MQVSGVPKGKDIGRCEVMILDSGASACVRSADSIQGHKIEESIGARTGVEYMTASGKRIANEGEVVLPMATEEGRDINMKFQIANVNRPLASVSAVCAAGNRVLFEGSDGESYVENKKTKERLKVHMQGGVYLIPAWVKKPAPPQTRSPPCLLYTSDAADE